MEWTDKDEELVQKEARWKDYDMAASAFGQGMNASTPIQLLRYVQGLANGGFMNTPHLFMRAVAGSPIFSDEPPWQKSIVQPFSAKISV